MHILPFLTHIRRSQANLTTEMTYRSVCQVRPVMVLAVWIEVVVVVAVNNPGGWNYVETLLLWRHRL
jgi:hypothetical protein